MTIRTDDGYYAQAVEPTEALIAKLHPARFTQMSGKMAAIVGCILTHRFTDPQIVELNVSSDRFVLARTEGDIGFNEFIGSFDDLKRNWDNLLEVADLTADEKELANSLFNMIGGQ